MKFNQAIYIDMDNTIANFSGADGALKRFKVEKGFFANLEPMHANLKAVKKLIADGNEVFIISHSPNVMADGDKRLWLHKYLPEMADGNIIFSRLGTKKTDYMKSPDGILFDDFSRNVFNWVCVNATNNRAVLVKADGDIQKGIFALACTTDLLINA